MDKVDSFCIQDIDGCEFVKSSILGNLLISFHQDFDGCYTGNVIAVYPDGSHSLISFEEAQECIDSSEWTILR